MKQIHIGICTILLMLSAPLHAQEVDRDVPYVPTPMKVVREMLDMAEVTSDDLVFDLGCGDGRIVITAAKEYGATGVGIDIDPQRIAESRINAADAGVDDRVTFREANLFMTDIAEATVVTLYLLSRINVQLRPRLLNELRPGTRVVSHNYDMDEWKPDKSKDMSQHNVHFWVVPANMTGIWRWEVPAEFGGGDAELRVEQDYQHFSGTVAFGGMDMPVSDGVIEGDTVTFVLGDEQFGETVFSGHIDSDTIDGTVTPPDGSPATNWKARRDPDSFRRLTFRQ